MHGTKALAAAREDRCINPSFFKKRANPTSNSGSGHCMMRFNMQDKEILGPFADGRLKRFLKNRTNLFLK